MKNSTQYGPRLDDAMSGPVHLIDYADELKTVVPEAVLQEGVHGGVKVSYYVIANLDVTRAASPDHAKQIIRELGEEVRLKATRDLGLRPIMDAYEREAANNRRAIELLMQQTRSLRETITNQETEIYGLRLELAGNEES